MLLADGLDFSQFAADLSFDHADSLDAFTERHERVVDLIELAARDGARHAEGQRLAGLIATSARWGRPRSPPADEILARRVEEAVAGRDDAIAARVEDAVARRVEEAVGSRLEEALPQLLRRARRSSRSHMSLVRDHRGSPEHLLSTVGAA